MTHQDTFNKVAAHLLKQLATSLAPDGTSCAYRGDKGRKCAIGCLIPDDLYTSAIEGLVLNELYSEFDPILQALGYTIADIPFLVELQQIHDMHSVASWADLLKEFANKHGISSQEVLCQS